MAYQRLDLYFPASTNWRACACEFDRVDATAITLTDKWGPLPNSALKFFLVGLCYEAAARAAAKATGEEVWSARTYWDAGIAYAKGIPNIQTFWAYRNALHECIQWYGTLSTERLRTILPFTEQERNDNVNAIRVMEDALLRCTKNHQAASTSPDAALLETWRELTATFHKFSVEFVSIGNVSEASLFRAMEHDLVRRTLIKERRYLRAGGYGIWKITANYGEGLARWVISCLVVLLAFSALFAVTHSAAPIAHRFDYFYFSTVTFATLGYGDIHPISTTGEVLACIEVAFGFVMFGILLTLIGNRLQRL